MRTESCSPWRRRTAAICVGVAGALILVACGNVLSSQSAREPAASDYAGLTKMAISEHYIVVVNVLPPEEMYTAAEVAKLHPTVGELVVDGRVTPALPTTRHTEAHVYAKDTGLPLSDVRPRMTLLDRVTGHVTDVDATLMQDVVLGASDRHFGSNVVIKPGHEFTIVVRVGTEEVSIDGILR